MPEKVIWVGANFRLWASAMRHLYSLLTCGLWTPRPHLLIPTSPQPPYPEAKVGDYVLAQFEIETRLSRALIPEPLVPARSCAAGLFHYVLGENSKLRDGVAPQQATILYVEVEGQDDPAGARGRHLAWGLYSQDSVITALAGALELPIATGSTAIATEPGESLKILAQGEDLRIESAIAPSGYAPVAMGGVFHHCSVTSAAGDDALQNLQVSPISWTAEVQLVDLKSLRMHFPAGHPLADLAPIRPLQCYRGRQVRFALGDRMRAARAQPWKSSMLLQREGSHRASHHAHPG